MGRCLIITFYGNKFNSFWCLECGAIPEATCEGRHAILDRMEDVKAIMGLLTDVSGTFREATELRQQIKQFLQAATAANDEGLHQLRSLAEKEQLTHQQNWCNCSQEET